jgi:RHS repeat-associated protein
VKKVTAAGTTLYIGPHYEVQPQPATPPSPPQPPSPLPRRAFLPLIFNSGLIVDGHLMQPVKYYLIGGQRIASRTGSAGPVTYYYHDQLGSTVGSSANEATRYWPYGATRSGNIGTAYRFTGQRQDVAGLYFYQSRWYDAQLGRFVQPDPLVPRPGDPQSLNRYAYARSNPLRYTDPTGHDIQDFLDTLSEVAGGVVAQVAYINSFQAVSALIDGSTRRTRDTVSSNLDSAS